MDAAASDVPEKAKSERSRWFTAMVLYFSFTSGVFFVLGMLSKPVSISYLQWKMGLYLLVAVTAIGLLAVFISIQHSIRSERYRQIKETLRGHELETAIPFMQALLIELSRAFAQRRTRQLVGEVEKKDLVNRKKEAEEELEEFLKRYPLIRRMREFATDDRRQKILRESLTLTLTAFFALALISALVASALVPAGSNPPTLEGNNYILGLAESANGMLIVALTLLIGYFQDYMRWLPKKDVFEEAIQDLFLEIQSKKNLEAQSIDPNTRQ